jgi:branched-chain amino acid transport system substrate-binding protein
MPKRKLIQSIILRTSLLEGKDISRENVKDLLEKGVIYPGVFGDIHVKPGEHNISFPLYPAQIVDGEVKYLR